MSELVEPDVWRGKVYYRDGKLKGNFQHNVKSAGSTRVRYYQTGETMSRGEVNEDLVVSVEIEDMCKTFPVPMTGACTAHYDNGTVKYESGYANGLRNGVLSTYYANGRAAVRANFADGQLHGWYDGFYENGAPEFMQAFVQGRLEGRGLGFFETGEVRYEWNYERGRIRSMTEYEKNGAIYGEWKWPTVEQRGGSVGQCEAIGRSGAISTDE